jgi:RNA recognition motif-containing protein
MSLPSEAQTAIESLHNTEFNGRNLVVRLDEKLVQA